MIDMPEILAKHGSDELVRCFKRYHVDFLVVGGAAVAAHGCRDSHDFDDTDFLVSPTIENAERVVAALAEARVAVPWQAKALARPEVQFQLKVGQYWADLVTPAESEAFSEMFQRSIEAKLGSEVVRVIGCEDLAVMKRRAVGRIAADLAKHKKDLNCLVAKR